MSPQTALSATFAAGLGLAAVVLTRGNLLHGSEAIALTPAFVVTSAEDAGPGTLRDAILAADRLSTRGHIVVSVKRVRLDTALPALINPHGVDLEASPGGGTIDGGNQATSGVLQINSPSSSIVGVHIVNARSSGFIINAAGVHLSSVTVSDSKIGVLINPSGVDAIIRASAFEHDDTGIVAAPSLRSLTILSTSFRGNHRAGFWFVGEPEKPEPHSRSAEQRAPARAQLTDATFQGNAEGVVTNQSIAVMRSHFVDNTDAAVLLLGGSARVELNDIRGSGGTGVSIAPRTEALVTGNLLSDNRSTAILVRDSNASIEHNTLNRNASGVVTVTTTQAMLSPVLEDNVVTRTTGDAITVIGGSCVLRRNQIVANGGAGIRSLDFEQGNVKIAATPRLEANQVKGNGVDLPAVGVYKMPVSRD
jgi:hypothetical protein